MADQENETSQTSNDSGLHIHDDFALTTSDTQNIPKCTKKASSIQAIDKGSVHRICSGQVVLTLATAVKELVENSVDAGATSVEVKLKDYGGESIEVIDNGSGVEEKNFEGLTLKHHTSKLQDFDDLVNVSTFGFRGEALSSLCALSNMIITTRHNLADVGTKLEFDLNGKLVTRKSAPRQIGTTVLIQNLFHTLPVRHKEFQRNLKKEFAKLVQVLNAYCIVNTGVRITCSNQTGKGNRNTVVSTKGNELMKENIANVFSPKQLQSLLEFQQVDAGDEICTDFGLKPQQKLAGGFKIEGFVSKCEHGQGRSSSDRQFIFINKRPCDNPKILKIINEVYHSYNRHQNPFVALNISMHKESVDVNVTPDKRQIFMEQERLLLAVLKTSLIQMFEPTTSVYKVNTFISQNHSTPSVSKTPNGIEHTSKPYTNETSGARNNSFRLLHPSNGENHKSENTSLSSSLSKLKRSFSSAFAKTDSLSSQASISPSKKTKSGFPMSLSSAKSNSLPSQLHSSDRGSITQFLSRFSPKKSPSKTTSHLSTSSECESHRTCIEFHDKDIAIDMTTSVNEVFETEQCHESLDNLGTNINAMDQNQTRITSVEEGDVITSSDDVLENECSIKVLHDVKDESQDSHVESLQKQHTVNNLSLVFHEDSGMIDNSSPVKGKGEPLMLTKASNSETGQECFESQDGCETISSNREDVIVTDLDLQDEDDDGVKAKKEKTIKFSFPRLRKKFISLKDKDSNSVSSFCRSFRAKICPGDNQSAEDELQREISKDMFEKMEILGQFNLGFIITKLGSDLFIVDQHATDEKYNFEMLQRHTVLQSQKMIVPQCLELTASNETILVDNLEVFKKNGFDFVINSDALPTQRVRLVSAPVSKNWSFGKDDIEELLFMLTDSPNVMCRPTRVRMMFASRACRKSIMIGTALNKSEMKRLVSHMGKIEQPWNCPHGRPTMRHLFNMDMLPS